MSAGADELELARRSADRFAGEVVADRGADLDSDPRACAEVLDEAATLGLVAFGEGAETGVFAWNDGSPDVTLASALLETLATTRAGFAFLVLVQGLASCAERLLGGAALEAPAGLVLPGGVLCWGGSLATRTYCIDDGRWGGAPELRTGPVPCGPVQVLGLCEAHPHTLADHWRAERVLDGAAGVTAVARLEALAALGGLAIAAGLARGALAAATRYAGERFQGGALIAELPVVRCMLERCAAQVHAIALLGNAAVARFETDAEGAAEPARAAFATAADACVECVTTSLQVLGGYGYMADFGLERRFRDAHALRLALGGARPRARRGEWS